MTMYSFACVASELVVNVIDASTQAIADEHAAAMGASAVDITSTDPRPGPGWSYIAGVFAPPTPTIGPRWINTNDFIARFTDAELGELQTLADTNNAVRGWVWWLDRQIAVDLDDARVVDRLQQAVTAGKLTQQRVDEILA